MTKQQNNLITSWVVGIPTFILALYAVDGESINWIIIFFVGFGICKYLRKDIEIEPWRPFEVMSQKARLISAIYYLCVLVFVLYMVLAKPDTITYSEGQYLILIFLIMLPIAPVMFKRELYIFHLAGKSNA